jgi:hypothetical protein
MGEKYEVDYPAIIAGMKKMLDEQSNLEFEYFELLKFMSEHGNETTQNLTAVSNNLMNLSMSDQVIFLRTYKSLLIVCETLQAKYNFEIPEEDPDEN